MQGSSRQGDIDTILVRRTLAGDLAAFDELVLRYRRAMLSIAISLLGDWDLAEDVTQQALLEAFRGLHGLQEGTKFRPWLLTITRRCAFRRRAQQHSTPLEFSEAVIYPQQAPMHPEDDIAECVRASLEELSIRHHLVVTLHYLDGYSCREIGDHLKLPTGTIKRILHESRASLRGSTVLLPGAERMRGEGKMKGTGPRDMDWWVNGSIDGGVLGMGRAITRAVCLAANKTPKTIAEIAAEVQAHPRYVLETLQPLLDEDLIREQQDGRYLNNFIAMDAADWIAWCEHWRGYNSQLADLLQQHLPALEAAWNGTSLPEQGFPWTTGIWPTLAIFVCNSGVFRHSPKQPSTPPRASNGSYWFGCHEKVALDQNAWSMGFNGSSIGSDQLAIGYWWSSDLRRTETYFSETRTRVMDAIAKGADDADVISLRTDQPIERVREQLAQLLELEMLTKFNSKIALNFPVFSIDDSDRLYPTVDAVAAQIANDVLVPRTEDTGEFLRSHGYGHVEEQFPAWRIWAESLIAGEAIRTLVSHGILSPPGDPAPANFCLIGWYDVPQRPRVLDWEL